MTVIGVILCSMTSPAHAAITDMQLGNASIDENTQSGTAIGTLSATGGTEPYIYTLTNGIGSEDNSYFTIDNDQLKINFTPDYENPQDTGDAVGNNTYAARVKVTDSGDASLAQHQTIATVGAFGWESFTIGADQYIIVANRYNGAAHNLNSYLYKWNGTNFVEHQTIATNGAADWEYFTIGTDHYIAVAHQFNGSSYNINSKIYKWNGTNFVEHQSIATSGAAAWECFSIGTDHYLVVANHYNGSSYNTNSYVYKWNGTNFVEHQSIATSGATEWEHFTIGTDHYLAVANQYNGSSFNIISKIYKWNGASFVEHQSIATSGAADWRHFAIDADHYIVVANYSNGSTPNTNSYVYKWNGTSFVEQQTIATSGARDCEHFTIGTDHYLAVANWFNGSSYNNNSKLYKWNGTSFAEQQTIATNGAFDWEHFTIGTDHYLAVANWYNDSSYSINSFIYKWGQSTHDKSFIITVNDVSEDITIQDPDIAKISDAVTDGYFTLNSGTITNTDSVTTAVNVTVQDTIFNALFPQNTTITETANQPFNFQNLIAQNVTQSVRNDQPTTRAAVRIGISGEKLNFSQLVTLTVSIGEAFNGQTLDILYQQEGESTWNTHGTCTITNGLCTFQTNHATIYTINGIHQATGDTPMNLNVEIQETLSMDCFDPSDSNTTVSLGTTTNPGLITAGTPAVGQSRCTVTTNADQGYYLTLTNANPANTTLTHTDPHTGTIYEIQDATAWNETTKTTQNWTAPTTKGLAFSIITFPESNTTHNQFSGVWNQTNQCPEGLTADTNEYAGIPTTPQAISAVTSYQSAATTTNICYKVDVPASQPSGQYSGQVMFTATSDASGYWE